MNTKNTLFIFLTILMLSPILILIALNLKGFVEFKYYNTKYPAITMTPISDKELIRRNALYPPSEIIEMPKGRDFHSQPPRGESIIYFSNPYFLNKEEERGSYHEPSVTQYHWMTTAGKRAYTVRYRTDKYGRRKFNFAGVKKEKHAVFLGGSYVFGSCVNDRDTLPYRFEERAKKYRAYNYGVGGWGPTNVLADLEQRDLQKEVDQKEGIGIYTYIEDHLSRTEGDYHWTIHGAQYPYYDYKGDTLVRSGSLQSGRPIMSTLYRWLHRFYEFTGVRRVNFPLFKPKSFADKTCSVIKKVERNFISQFPQSKFYVLFHPYAGRDWTGYLAHCLKEKKNLNVIIATNYFFQREGITVFKNDYHPTGFANDLLAELLVQKLGN